MSIHKLGKFGENVKQYEKGRRGYIPEVFRFLQSLLKVEKPLILDIGCGTGIATRQLTKLGPVIGADPDPRMLKAARVHKTPRVQKYIVAKADKLPFKDGTFDVVTAFSAFHWFDDKKSVLEIKRVLKPGGVFFSGHKIGVKSWGEGYRRAIIKGIGRQIAGFASREHDPVAAIKQGGFQNIVSKHWRRRELFSLPQAVQYAQSISIWNSIPRPLHKKAIESVRDHYQKIHEKFGKIERRLNVRAIAGRK